MDETTNKTTEGTSRSNPDGSGNPSSPNGTATPINSDSNPDNGNKSVKWRKRRQPGEPKPKRIETRRNRKQVRSPEHNIKRRRATGWIAKRNKTNEMIEEAKKDPLYFVRLRLKEVVMPALNVIVDLMLSKETNPREKLAAAKYIMEANFTIALAEQKLNLENKTVDSVQVKLAEALVNLSKPAALIPQEVLDISSTGRAGEEQDYIDMVMSNEEGFEEDNQ